MEVPKTSNFGETFQKSPLVEVRVKVVEVLTADERKRVKKMTMSEQQRGGESSLSIVFPNSISICAYVISRSILQKLGIVVEHRVSLKRSLHPPSERPHEVGEFFVSVIMGSKQYCSVINVVLT